MSRLMSKRPLLTLLVLLFLILFVHADDCPTDGTDNFLDKVTVDPATGFTVTYDKYYKTVENLRANESYVLYCSASPPNSTASFAKSIKVPVQSVASLDLTTVSFLEILGVSSSLKYVANLANVTTPCLQGNNISTFIDHVTTPVDVVFANVSTNSDSNYVQVALEDDLNPLQKVEWIKFVSLFFNQEKKANDAFANIKSNYNCNAGNVNNVPDANKKMLAWIAYDPNAKIYHVRNSTYFSQLIRDAGAISPPISQNSFDSLPDFHSAIANAYAVIDQTPLSSNDTFDVWQKLFGYYPTGSSSNSLPPFIQYLRVWRVDKLVNSLGIDDWSETAMARADLMLRDLISVQYPTYESSYQPTWLENFSKSDQVHLLKDCSSSEHNANPTFDSCLVQNFTGDNQFAASGINPTPSNDSHQKNKGAIIGYSILGAAILGIAGFALALYARKKYRAKFIKMNENGTKLTQSKGEIKVVKPDST